MIKLSAGREYEYVEKGFRDFQLYPCKITNILSSYDEDRSPKPGKGHWVMFQLEVDQEDTKAVRTSLLTVVTELDKDGNHIELAEGTAKLIDLYQKATGMKAPEEIELDNLFLDLQNKKIITKVWAQRVTKKNKDKYPGLKVGDKIMNDSGYAQYQASFNEIILEPFSEEREKQILDEIANEDKAAETEAAAVADGANPMHEINSVVPAPGIVETAPEGVTEDAQQTFDSMFR